MNCSFQGALHALDFLVPSDEFKTLFKKFPTLKKGVGDFLVTYCYRMQFVPSGIDRILLIVSVLLTFFVSQVSHFNRVPRRFTPRDVKDLVVRIAPFNSLIIYSSLTKFFLIFYSCSIKCVYFSCSMIGLQTAKMTRRLLWLGSWFRIIRQPLSR